MPKKTRKEKIIAEYRRRLQASAASRPAAIYETSQNSHKNAPSLQTAPIYKLTGPANKDVPKITTSSPAAGLSDFPAIRHDLAKTLMLAVIAVTTELLLYWKIGR